MKLKPKHGIWLVGAAAIVVALVYQAGSEAPGGMAQSGDTVTSVISEAKGDATVVFDITLQEGGDAEHEAEHVFEALGSSAIERASLDTATLKLEVAYDSAAIGEQDIRQMLAARGYVGVTAADAVAATISSDGTRQEIALTPGERLDPPLVSAKAGIPLSIVFSAGQGHLSSVSIEALGVQQDISQGGTLELSALQPGTYDIMCAEGFADGTLIVE